MEFTRIPKGASSMAATFVIPRTANLLAEYAIVAGEPAMPSMEEMFTIDARAAVVIAGIADPEEDAELVHADDPQVFPGRGVNDRRQGRDTGIVHEHVEGAEGLHDVVHACCPGLFVGHVEVDVSRAGPQLLGEHLSFGIEHVGDRDLGAVLHE
jgi:hypothetical protein